jgi:hypothetical protein
MLGTDEVPDLVPADVGHALNHVRDELARGRLADRAGPPGLLAERRLEHDVVGEHVDDAVQIVRVPDLPEPPHERFAVKRHGPSPLPFRL